MQPKLLSGGQRQLVLAHARQMLKAADSSLPGRPAFPTNLAKSSVGNGSQSANRKARSILALVLLLLRRQLVRVPQRMAKAITMLLGACKGLVKHMLSPVFTHPILTAASVLLASEGLFAFWFKHRYTRLGDQPDVHQPEEHDGYKAFSNVLQFIQMFTGRPALATKLRKYISTWFHNTPWQDLRLGNLEEHLAYSFFYASPEAVRASGQGPLLSTMLDQLKQCCALDDIEDGYNSQVKAMWHLNEPLKVQYRPLTFYLVMELLACIAHTGLRVLGFKKGRADGFTFWHKGMAPPTHPNNANNTAPEASGSTTSTDTSNSNSSSAPKRSVTEIPSCLSTGPLQGLPGGLGNGPRRHSTADLHTSSKERAGAARDRSRLSGVRGAAAGGWDVSVGSGEDWSGSVMERTSSCPTFQELVNQAYAVTRANALADETQMHRQQEADAQVGRGSGPLPIVFLHGVGVGLLAYLPVIFRLQRGAKKAGLPMLVMEFKHVSLRLCRSVPTADTVATAVVSAINHLGLTQVCMVAHSYGTFVASRFTQMYGHRIKGLVLVDPVCFGMFLPHLLYNFVYGTTRRDSLWNWIKDSMVRFTAQELHCAATFCRKFYWTSVQLDPAQLPEHSLVILGGQDELLHGEEVAFAVSAEAVKRQGGDAQSPFPEPPASIKQRPDPCPTLTSGESSTDSPAHQGLNAQDVHHTSSTSSTSTTQEQSSCDSFGFPLLTPPDRLSGFAATMLVPGVDSQSIHNTTPTLANGCARGKATAPEPISSSNTNGVDLAEAPSDHELTQAGSSAGQDDRCVPSIWSKVQSSKEMIMVGGASPGQGMPGTVLQYIPGMAHADFMFSMRLQKAVVDDVIGFASVVAAEYHTRSPTKTVGKSKNK